MTEPKRFRYQTIPASFVMDHLGEFGPEDMVLDFGCGNGRNAVPILRRGAHVTLYDRNPKALAEAERAAKKTGGRFDVVRANDSGLPRKYDKILLIGVLHMYPEKSGIISECHSFLKDDGLLYSSSFGTPKHCKSPYCFSSPVDFADAHYACGFEHMGMRIVVERSNGFFEGVFRKAVDK